LYQDEQGNMVPIYDKGQTVTGGGGDILLKFTGIPNSGFRYCDATV
jgi:hypothetical protein